MSYVVAALVVAGFWVWSMTPVVRVWGGVLFAWYRVLGFASDRESVLRFHRWVARAFAVVATTIAAIGVILRATGS